MGVGFGRSKVADLAFQVFNRSLHPEWFATREFRRVEQKRWTADVRIVDGGHTVVFLSGSVHLTEVLCGPESVVAGVWPAFLLATPPRAVDDPSPGRNDRISKLPRGGTSRHRDLPSPLRGDGIECVRQPVAPSLSRFQPLGTSADQPHPDSAPGLATCRSSRSIPFPMSAPSSAPNPCSS